MASGTTFLKFHITECMACIDLRKKGNAAICDATSLVKLVHKLGLGINLSINLALRGYNT